MWSRTQKRKSETRNLYHVEYRIQMQATKFRRISALCRALRFKIGDLERNLFIAIHIHIDVRPSDNRNLWENAHRVSLCRDPCKMQSRRLDVNFCTVCL